MDFPSWARLPQFNETPTLPSLPTLDEVKEGATELYERVVTGESDQTPAVNTESENLVNGGANTETDFDVATFRMPERREPEIGEIIQEVSRLEQPVRGHDMNTIGHYAASQNQYDSTDPQAYVLETAAGYAEYLPVEMQEQLATQLDSTYQQAVRNDVSRALDSQSGGAFSALPAEQQSRLVDLLTREDMMSSLLPEVQGAGGSSAASGIASGEAGHYVNSPLTSAANLVSAGRINDSTLSALEGLVSTELSLDLEDQRGQIISSAMQNIAFPESIAQHSRGTCAATIPEMLFAQNDPAEYLRSLTGLVSAEGSTELESGADLVLSFGAEREDDSGRSISSRLMQSALMELANGDTLDYNNAQDKHMMAESGLVLNSSGLMADEATVILNAVLGENAVAETLAVAAIDGVTQVDRETLNAQVFEAVESGRAVPVGVHWADGGHKLLVTGFDEQNVEFYNPWGELNTMPRAEFESRLKNASIPSESWSLPAPAQNSANYHEIDARHYMSTAERAEAQAIQGYQDNVKDLASRISDPAVRAEVESIVGRIQNPEQMLSAQQAINEYLFMQDFEISESDISALRSALSQI